MKDSSLANRMATWLCRNSVTYNCPGDECNGSKDPHHELDEAHKEVRIESIVAVINRKAGRLLEIKVEWKSRCNPRYDCSIISMYDCRYHIE